MNLNPLLSLPLFALLLPGCMGAGANSPDKTEPPPPSATWELPLSGPGCPGEDPLMTPGTLDNPLILTVYEIDVVGPLPPATMAAMDTILMASDPSFFEIDGAWMWVIPVVDYYMPVYEDLHVHFPIEGSCPESCLDLTIYVGEYYLGSLPVDMFDGSKVYQGTF